MHMLTPAKGRPHWDSGCETQASKRTKRQKTESQEMGGDDITQGERRKVVLPKRFEVGMAPVVVVKAEAEAPSRAAHRQEGGRRFKERCFDKDEARRKRTETSDSRRKERRGELKKKKRLDDGGRKAITGEPTRRAIDLRLHESAPLSGLSNIATLISAAIVIEEEAASDVDLLGGFPLLELPEELQLLVAAHVVSSPRDRAALCVAAPPLGRKAIKAIPAYTGPLMSLGNRVLSGGALSEAEVRRYVREFAPSEFEHWSLALNECAQLNAIAAPSARVRCVAHHPHPWWSNHLQWRLESGALLRSWEPFDGPRNDIRSRRVRNYVCGTTTGAPGIHHYEGAAGAERLVALAYADGYVHGFVGERGAELMIEPPPSYDGGDDFGDDLGDSAISYPDMAMISALISALSRA